MNNFTEEQKKLRREYKKKLKINLENEFQLTEEEKKRRRELNNE